MNSICIIGTLLLLGGIILAIYRRQPLASGIMLFVMVLVYYWHTNLNRSRVLVVAVSPDYPPYCFIKEGKIVGIDISLLENIATQMNTQLELKPMSFSFLFNHLRQNKSQVATGGLSVTPDREKYCNFSTAYVGPFCGILYKKDILLDASFTGNIGVQTGSIFTTIVKTKFPLAKVLEIDDFMVLIESLKKSNRIDAVVGDILVLLDIFNTDKFDYILKKISHDYPTRGTAFALSKRMNIEAFNLLLDKAVKSNNQLRNLLDTINQLEEV